MGDGLLSTRTLEANPLHLPQKPQNRRNSPASGLLLVYGSDKGNDKDGGDQHQPAGRDEAQGDEEDGAGSGRIPRLGRPHEGEERGEEGEEDQDHTSWQIPYLDRRPLHRVGHPSPRRVAGLPHALYGPAELRLSREPDDPREVVGLGRGLAHPEQLEVVAPVQLDRARVRGGELLEEGVGVEAGSVAPPPVGGGGGLAPPRAG